MKGAPAALLLALLGSLAASAPAQEGEPPVSSGLAVEGETPQQIPYEQLPPSLRLGVRVQMVRRKLPVLPVVVIATRESAYAEAIGRWTLGARYPVLLDDGTPEAREHIARFVRAFKPASVLRWDGPAEARWPADAAGRRALIEAAVARAWEAEAPADGALDQAAALARWKELQLEPPGLVAADPTDGAWTAALALAAGRAQPIAWVRTERVVHRPFMPDAAAALEESIERAAEGWGLPWRGLGEGLDAVTLALNCPAKVEAGAEAYIATTDRIGREGEGEGTLWAWTGQIFGRPAEAAYRAMCALFLIPDRAWLFDGYPDSAPWNHWDATGAAELLEKAGFQTTLDDTPAQGAVQWRRRAAGPIDAGLILVNSKGNQNFFDLQPGRCYPGDVPILEVPAIVHFVHSFSAASPSRRTTVAGRWLERGAYAYFGSVHEPFLQAFVPTPMVAARLALGLPFGAAVRYDETPGRPRAAMGKVAKLTVLGDPLVTLGEPAPRVGGEPDLPGAIDLDESLKEALAERRLAEAIELLVLLGRDGDAARLAAALLNDEPSKVTPELAAAAIMPLFREGMAGALVRAYGQLRADAAARPDLRDALWLACGRDLRGTRDERMVAVLRTNLREDSLAHDAAALARPMMRIYGREAAAAMLEQAARQATNDRERQEIEEVLRNLGGPGGR